MTGYEEEVVLGMEDIRPDLVNLNSLKPRVERDCYFWKSTIQRDPFPNYPYPSNQEAIEVGDQIEEEEGERRPWSVFVSKTDKLPSYDKESSLPGPCSYDIGDPSILESHQSPSKLSGTMMGGGGVVSKIDRPSTVSGGGGFGSITSRAGWARPLEMPYCDPSFLSTPKPGEYQDRIVKKQKVVKNSVPFNSSEERDVVENEILAKIKKEEEEKGKSRKELIKEKMQNKKSKRNFAFINNQDGNSGNRKEVDVVARRGMGPGKYDLSNTDMSMVAIVNEGVGRNGVFGSTTPRFRRNYNVRIGDRIEEKPSVSMENSPFPPSDGRKGGRVKRRSLLSAGDHQEEFLPSSTTTTPPSFSLGWETDVTEQEEDESGERKMKGKMIVFHKPPMGNVRRSLILQSKKKKKTWGSTAPSIPYPPKKPKKLQKGNSNPHHQYQRVRKAGFGSSSTRGCPELEAKMYEDLDDDWSEFHEQLEKEYKESRDKKFTFESSTGPRMGTESRIKYIGHSNKTTPSTVSPGSYHNDLDWVSKTYNITFTNLDPSSPTK